MNTYCLVEAERFLVPLSDKHSIEFKTKCTQPCKNTGIGGWRDCYCVTQESVRSSSPCPHRAEIQSLLSHHICKRTVQSALKRLLLTHLCYSF